MSFKAFVWAWDQDVPNGDYQHVLLAIANIAPIREAKASVPYIAKSVRRSPRKVRAALDWLAEAQLITITERPGKTDIIRLNIPADFKVTMDEDGDLENGVRGRPRKPLHPEKTPAQSGGKPLPNPCTPCADEPLEPQKEEPKRATDVALSAVPSDASPARQAFDAYNRFAKAAGKSEAMKLTDSRRQHLNARMKECGGVQGWLEALERAERSPFLMGCTHHRFMISLDFLLQPSSFTKLSEGFYDGERNGSGPASGGSDARHSGRNAALVAGALAAVDRRKRQ